MMLVLALGFMGATCCGFVLGFISGRHYEGAVRDDDANPWLIGSAAWCRRMALEARESAPPPSGVRWCPRRTGPDPCPLSKDGRHSSAPSSVINGMVLYVCACGHTHESPLSPEAA